MVSYGLENVERLYDVDDSLLLDPADEATDPRGTQNTTRQSGLHDWRRRLSDIDMRSLCSVTCVPPRLAAITGGDTGNAEELGVAERVSMHCLLMS